jgi:rhodanese-related sulfurtransferase
MKTIDADQLDSLLDGNDPVQLVDVLPPEHYDKVHLPGARNLPVDELGDRALEELDLDRPVIVYCSGPDCGMSPKAGQLLDTLGFEEVYDFEGGLANWIRSGRDVIRNGDAVDRKSS